METNENKNRIYGPILPTNIDVSLRRESSKNEYFGPQLPPHLEKKKNEIEDEDENPSNEISDNSIITESNKHIEKEEYCDLVGPLPSTLNTPQNKELEERALEIKIRSIDDKAGTSKDEKSREEWMTELPGLDKSGLGIFARQFRKREGPDMSDRSIWTDTPNATKKPKKSIETLIEKTKFDYEKDKEQDAVIKKHKKKHKRDKTLMEIHAKKLKKEKKKKDKEKEKSKPERRPFNREEDLQVNRFDQARKQAVIKKAQLLDTRFSTGKSKYL